MSKRIFVWVVVALTGLGIFIGLHRMKKAETEALNQRHAILKALNQRDRNSVYLALRALQDGKIRIAYTESINFDSPYSEVQPTIKRIVHLVNALPAEKLSALDETFDQHRKYYSAIWLPGDWP